MDGCGQYILRAMGYIVGNGVAAMTVGHGDLQTLANWRENLDSGCYPDVLAALTLAMLKRPYWERFWPRSEYWCLLDKRRRLMEDEGDT